MSRVVDPTPLLAGDARPRALQDALGAHPAPAWDASPVVFFNETGSTNDVASALAARGAAHGTVVLARAQTAGRGRRGRSWASPADAGLYFSCIVRPRPDQAPGVAGAPPAAMLITLTAAVAVVDAIERVTGFTPGIKWPNDLVADRGRDAVSGVWHRRKLAGILAEGAISGDAVQHIVLGVGINLTPAAYPPEVAAIATSLTLETGHDSDGFVLFAACRASLARDIAHLLDGEAASLLDRWRQRAPSAEGARVRWDRDGRAHEGVTAGLGEDGALRVRLADGRVVAIVAGEVEWL